MYRKYKYRSRSGRKIVRKNVKNDEHEYSDSNDSNTCEKKTNTERKSAKKIEYHIHNYHVAPPIQTHSHSHSFCHNNHCTSNCNGCTQTCDSHGCSYVESINIQNCNPYYRKCNSYYNYNYCNIPQLQNKCPLNLTTTAANSISLVTTPRQILNNNFMQMPNYPNSNLRTYYTLSPSNCFSTC